MKQPTHAAHYDSTKPDVENVDQYLLDHADDVKATAIVKELAKGNVSVDTMLATLVFATAIALHGNYAEEPAGEEIACGKSAHLSRFFHVLVHSMFDFDRKENEEPEVL